MKKANVQLIVYPIDQLRESDQKVLAYGKAFAEKYALSAPNEMIRIPGKKPRFDSGGVYFSISHSGDYWVCTLSDVPVGVDIQDHKTCKTDSIARRFFHPDEVAWLADRKAEDFFLIWAAKESYVKFTGEGITGSFSKFSVVDADGKITYCNQACLSQVPFEEGYSLFVCTAISAHVTTILVGPGENAK